MRDSIFDGFLRGTHREDLAIPPRAEFVFEESIRQSNLLRFDRENRDGKFFLGAIDGDVQERDTPQRWVKGGRYVGIRDNRHIVTVAGSRAGKGRSAIIPNLLLYPGSVLVIDPKGENVKWTARYRRDVMQQQVHVLDPFNVSKVGLSASFNPLGILDITSPTLIEDAGLIADALVVPSGETSVHWDESARQFIETLVLHVSTHPKYEGRRDLLAVKDLSDSVENKKIEDELGGNEAADGAVMAGALQFYQRPDNERGSVLSTLRRHLHFLGYQQMRRVLQGRNSIDLKDLKRKHVTIYLCLPAMRMGTCSRWLRLFVNVTLAQMEAVHVENQKHQVLMCLDEFAVLGTMKTIEDAAGQIAGLGVKLWPILQDLGQLKALYKDRWETFLGNAGVMQFFGNSDVTTLEWISKRCGETTVVNVSNNMPTFDQRTQQGAKGHSFAEARAPLLTLDEAARFFARDDEYLRQLIIRPGFPPMVLHRLFYDQHELFQKARDGGTP